MFLNLLTLFKICRVLHHVRLFLPSQWIVFDTMLESTAQRSRNAQFHLLHLKELPSLCNQKLNEVKIAYFDRLINKNKN